MLAPLVLEAPLAKEFLPIAQNFVENSAQALGLEQRGRMGLALATEEIFMGLCDLTPKARWEVRDGGFFVELLVQFSGHEPELHKLNLTAGIDVQDAQELEQMGWLLAARSVDRFQIEHHPSLTRFRLRKDRAYEEGVSQDRTSELGSLDVVRMPDVQELQLFASLALANEDGRLLPEFVRRPGLMQAMVQSGHLSARLAFSSRGQILGGGFLQRTEGRVANLHGPFVLNDDSDTGVKIFHQLLSSLAKSKLVGVVAEDCHRRLPESEMESLGRRTLNLGKAEQVELIAAYRHLEEEEGFTVWADTFLSEFLKSEYDRLALPRDLNSWKDMGAEQKCSVLACDFRPQLGEVVLKPVLGGTDTHQNIGEHLELFARESIPNIVFELDLGRSWQLGFAEALEHNGFKPCYLIPSAGKGDILVLQRGEQA